MRCSSELNALMPALLEAKRAMSPVHKDKRNDHFKYTYANEQAWFEAVQPALLQNGLILTFSVPFSERAGTLTTVRGIARITHAVSGQWLEVDGIGEGEDKNDKAAYKAMTGLKKYLYALAFSLPTTDDVEDSTHDKRRAAEVVKAEVKAAKTTASVSEVNGALVAKGLEPQHVDPEVKAHAKSLFDRAKLIDYSEANRIKRTWGTDYARMAEELDLYIAGAPKKEIAP